MTDNFQELPHDIFGLTAVWADARSAFADASKRLHEARSAGNIGAAERARLDLDEAHFQRQVAANRLMAILHALLLADRVVFGDVSLSSRIERLEERLEYLEGKRARKAVKK